MRRAAAATLALETGLGAELASLVFSRFTIHAGSDFAVYYAAARALRLAPAANIYSWPVIQASMPPVGACWLIPSPFVYPPLLAILLEPLTLLPCAAAIHVWEVLNALLLSGALYLVGRLWSQSLGTYALFCAATLLSFPLLQGLFFGQIHLLIFFGLLLALLRYTRSDQIGAGIVLGVTAWIQVIPGLFLFYWLLRRDWRALASMLVTGLLALLGMVLLLGPQWLSHYLASIGHSYTLNTMATNASLIYQLGIWAALTALAIYLVILWRYRGDQTTAYFWTVATMILVSPIAWPYFVLWLFPAFLLWWQRNTPRWRLLVVGCYLLLYFTNSVAAIQTIVVLAAWLVLGWDYVRSARHASPTWSQVDEAAGAPHTVFAVESATQPASPALLDGPSPA